MSIEKGSLQEQCSRLESENRQLKEGVCGERR